MASTADTSDEDVPVPVKRRIDGVLESGSAEPVGLPEVPEPEEVPDVPELPDPLELTAVPELPEPVELPDVPTLPDPAEVPDVPELPDPTELLDELPDPVELEDVPELAEPAEVPGDPGAVVAVTFGPMVEPGVPQAVRKAEIATAKTMTRIRGGLAAVGVTTGGTIPPFGLPTNLEPAKDYLGVLLALSNGKTGLDVVRF